MDKPKTPVRQRLAIQVGNRRRRKLMTQDELAALVGVTRLSVIMWEKLDEDNCFPTPENLDVLANVLGCDVTKLLAEP